MLYFVFNLSLTLYNKGVLVHFPFPYTLTALHALCGAVGGWSLRAQGAFVPKRLSATDNVALMTFSVLYAMNIAVSNVSLNLVTVPFHQVVRAATPIFTIVLSTMMFGTRFSPRKLISLIPVIVGVGFATYGDYYATGWGLLLTLLGTFLAALKTIFTNVLQSTSVHIPSRSSSLFLPPALSLHPLDLLTRMCPLAFIQCVFYALLSGELNGITEWSSREMTWLKAVGLLVNGCIAFGLNVVSFTANKKAGALSMTVAANIKQVLTILFAVLLFNLNITLMNGAGIIFTLAGGAWYGYVDYGEKRKRQRRERTLVT
jgi:drug/metabolite transporter (DMT)-like permease